jgi:hypothetical protein
MAYDRLNDFQKKLTSDQDTQESFISNSHAETKTPERKNSTSQEKIYKNIEQMLFDKLEQQYKKLSAMQKKLYELQNENNIEEVKSRYLKLDLNNAQVENSELKTYKRYFTILSVANVSFALTFGWAIVSRFYQI